MLKLASQTVARFSFGLGLHHFDSVASPMHEMVQLIAQILTLNKRISSRGELSRKLPFGDPKELGYTRANIYSILRVATNKAIRPGATDLQLHEAALEATCVADYLMRAAESNGEKLPTDLAYANMIALEGWIDDDVGLAFLVSVLSR